MSSPPTSSSLLLSPSGILEERHCPFYLRERCRRDKCEFKHDPEKLKAVKAERAAKAEQDANAEQDAKENDMANKENDTSNKENDMARALFLLPSASPIKNKAPSVVSGGFS